MNISVLTPSYGYGRFLGDCLRSVENQSGVDVEHVINDGGSQDGTVDLLAASGANWTSQPDRGQSDALNLALSRSSGDWVAWLNADEFLLPNGLASLLAAAKPGVGVVFGESMHVDVAGRLLRHVGLHRFDRFVLRYYGCFIPTCAVLIRRDLLEACGWDRHLRVVMDWDLFLQLAERAEFGYVPTAVAAFRLHERQVTAAKISFIDSEEHTQVRTRHGLPTNRREVLRLQRLARLRHRALKIGSGGYQREAAARRDQGRDLSAWLP
jgi:glycosyltransferase involved in cell wall biosynthesis